MKHPQRRTSYWQRGRIIPFFDRISSLGVGYSMMRKLRSSYSGSALAVNNSSLGLTDLQVRFVNNQVDYSGLASYLGGSVGVVHQWMNQGNLTGGSIADRMVSNGTAAPKIWDGSALYKMSNGHPAMLFPTAASTHNLNASNFLGGSANNALGSPALTIGISFARVSGSDRLFNYGSVAGFFIIDAEVPNVHVAIGAGGSRDFAYTNTANLPHSWIFQKAANSNVTTWTVEEGGVALAQAASASGTLNVAADTVLLGNIVGSTDSLNGYVNCLIAFPSVLTGNELAELRLELAAHA